ncbi:MAG: hypothetical protein A2X02_09660 [Bacteroidetes bacterium GWF2_29_10]|nr:MAG: hypothetical protein A2X02_09660 [Bacteroidetes bacterium GWF2_29_10]
MKVKRKKYVAIDKLNEKVDLSLMDKTIKKYKGEEGNIIPVLQSIQEVYGYINKSAVEYVAKKLELSKSYFWEVATFYSQFKLEQRGKHIVKICQGTACHVQNSKSILNSISGNLNIQEGETTTDKLFTIESVACVGCCSLAPVMVVDGETFGKLDEKKAIKIISNMKSNDKIN